jgi:hypothetical protein
LSISLDQDMFSLTDLSISFDQDMISFTQDSISFGHDMSALINIRDSVFVQKVV